MKGKRLRKRGEQTHAWRIPKLVKGLHLQQVGDTQMGNHRATLTAKGEHWPTKPVMEASLDSIYKRHRRVMQCVSQ